MAWPKILNPWEILKEVGIVAGFDALKGHFKSVAGREVAERVFQEVKKSFEESRAELMAFIIRLGVEDDTASKNLKRRQEDRQLLRPQSYGQKKPYKSGDETKYVNLLTKLYKALDSPDEVDDRKEVFKFLGHMLDEEFDTFIEFLSHDVIIQWIKRSWSVFKEVWQVVYPKGLKFLQDRLVVLAGASSYTELQRRSRDRILSLQAEIASQKRKGAWQRWLS